MLLLEKIRETTQTAKEQTEKSKLTIQVRSLLNQLTVEIDRMIKKGEWDFAVRLSHYRHEFAKTHSNLDWYNPYLEVRKVRDYIRILVGND